jgi:hypothetical protein
MLAVPVRSITKPLAVPVRRMLAVPVRSITKPLAVPVRRMGC